jgi:hypothetical protein
MTYRPLTSKERTAWIDKAQRRHPNTRRQRGSHGAGRYSVQFFDRATGKLVADYYLPEFTSRENEE